MCGLKHVGIRILGQAKAWTPTGKVWVPCPRQAKHLGQFEWNAAEPFPSAVYVGMSDGNHRLGPHAHAIGSMEMARILMLVEYFRQLLRGHGTHRAITRVDTSLAGASG